MPEPADLQGKDFALHAQAEHELMRLVVEAAPNALILADREGRIAMVNAQTEKLFGYPRAELLAQPLEILVPERFRAAHPGLRTDYVAHPDARAMGAGRDLFGRRKDGSEVPIEIGLNPLVTGEGTLVLASIIDITERKREEDLLRRTNAEMQAATEKAQAADRLKSVFLAVMSHELRTPLNSIIGFTGILLQGLAGSLNPEQTKQLGMVQSSARHLLTLINDILDISKIEAGEIKVVHEPFDLRASIGKIAGIVQPLAEQKGLMLNTEVAPEIDMLTSDRRRVEQVLLNLLNNAVKFTDHGGVTLRADVVAPPSGPAVSVRVIDTGSGIKPENMDKLFKPFQQVNSGLARSHEGTGLGLAICKRLIILLGGEIGVRSEWGEGSTFEFMLPLLHGDLTAVPER
jgi:protein-histidine pros-kinase